MGNFGLDNAAELGLNIVVPGGGVVADLLQNIVGNIGIDIKGKTPLMDWDTENKIARVCVDSVCSAVLAQIPLLAESEILAAMAIQELESFAKSYQLDVENLGGIRQSIVSDNWADALGDVSQDGSSFVLGGVVIGGTSVNTSDIPTLAAKLGGNRMYAASFWRCAMFILYNISSNSDDTTLPSRIVQLYAWHTALIAKFSQRIGRNIDPIAKSTSAIITAAGKGSPESLITGVKDVTVLETDDVTAGTSTALLIGAGLIVLLIFAFKKKG